MKIVFLSCSHDEAIIGAIQEPPLAISMGPIAMPIATLNMVRVDRRQKAPLQSQLYKQIRELIVSGQLKAGLRLPSTRDLVGQLSVSRNTIVYALDRLVAEGYLRSRTGSGIYVEDLPGRDEGVEPTGRNVGNRSREIPKRFRQFSELSISPS